MDLDDPATKALLAEAADQGATRALERVGLHDEDAAGDIRDIRGLLDAWRDAKRTVRRTFFRWLTTIFLMALAGYVAAKLKLFS